MFTWSEGHFGVLTLVPFKARCHLCKCYGQQLLLNSIASFNYHFLSALLSTSVANYTLKGLQVSILDNFQQELPQGRLQSGFIDRGIIVVMTLRGHQSVTSYTPLIERGFRSPPYALKVPLG